jgi:hypothetical protein
MVWCSYVWGETREGVIFFTWCLCHHSPRRKFSDSILLRGMCLQKEGLCNWAHRIITESGCSAGRAVTVITGNIAACLELSCPGGTRSRVSKSLAILRYAWFGPTGHGFSNCDTPGLVYQYAALIKKIEIWTRIAILKKKQNIAGNIV